MSISKVNSWKLHAPTHTNQDKLALLIGYSCASSRFPITSLTLTKYSVWPSCHKFQNLPSQKLLKLLPIISRQFRAFVDKKSTPFSHPLSLWFSCFGRHNQKNWTKNAGVLLLSPMGRGRRGEKKKNSFWLKLFGYIEVFCQLPPWLYSTETMPRGMTAIYYPSKLHSKAFIQKVFHQHTEAKLHFL